MIPAPPPPEPRDPPAAGRPAAAPESGIRSGLARLGQFVILTLRKSGRDGILLQSSALAFSTVFAIIPLLAAFLFVGQHIFREYQPQVLGILKQLLPYSDQRLLQQIELFLGQAERLSAVGFAGFMFVLLIAMASVEGTLNRIWNVSSSRAIRTRLYSVLMLLLWGPLLIGAAYSTLALLRRQTDFDRLWHQSLFFMAIPLLATALGLTMLYWAVPNTAVRFRCALAGGVTAALLIEVLRAAFKLYLRLAPNLNLVYGGFALALFFMISIDSAWLIVLFGSEVSYTAQHFPTMARRRRDIAPLEGGWLGAVVLALVTEEQRQGRPAVALEELAAKLELHPAALRQGIAPLLAGGLLADAGRSGEGYRLGDGAERVELERVFELYDGRQRQFFESLAPETAERFLQAQAAFVEARRGVLAGRDPSTRRRDGPQSEPLDSKGPEA